MTQQSSQKGAVEFLHSSPDFLKQVAGWITALIGFITSLVNFIKLLEGDLKLVTVVLLASGILILWGSFFYIYFWRNTVRQSPGFTRGEARQKYIYSSKARRIGLIGIVAMPILTLACFVGWNSYTSLPLGQLVILVADFEGPDPQNYRVTEKIIQRLRDATNEYSDITIRALGQAIKEDQGSDIARDIGMKRKASIVLWGYYGATSEAVNINVYFEVVRAPQSLSLRRGVETQTLPISELNEFKIQTRLSGEMTYLTLLTIGLARYDSGHYDSAISLFTKALAQSEVPNQMIDPADIYFYRGNAYYYKVGANGIKQALADYDKAIEINPAFAAAYINRGSVYANKGQHDRALADYDKAIGIDPPFAEAYYNRGLTYSKGGQYDRAIADYDKAIRINPNFAEAYGDRGVAYKKKGQYDRAIADYDKAIEINPDFENAYVNRGNVYSDKGEQDRAIADYDKAIRINPDSADAYYCRADVHSMKGHDDRAVADYDKAIEINPDYAEAYYNRGVIYVRKGQHDRAIADFDKAIEINPDFAIAYSNRGSAYSDEGQRDRAIADYDRAIEINPVFAVAYYNRALAYRDRGEFDRAIADLKSVLRTTDDQNLRQLAQQKLQQSRGK